MRLLLFLLLTLLPLLAISEQLMVTPYRPTISNPAELSALRHLEVEFGAQSIQTGQTVERNSLPFLLKYPFAEQWGLMVGGEAWINARDQEGTVSGFGNTTVMLKHYQQLSQTLAVGIEAGASLPSARSSLGQGRTDYLTNLIVSQDIADLRIDINAGVTRRGFKPAGGERFMYSWAIAASQMFTQRWGLAGEFSGVLAEQQAASTQFLTSFNYQVTPQVMLDFGGTVGMTEATDEYVIFTGVSWLIAP
ncbi:MAG: hypothetical protein D4R63_10985 [Methylococcaceae bacterium]|jgi:hypothetical protein|nr:MAG: hypothetical protein D4R63_10985 [Methylococcaceae bacterium]